MAVRIPANPFGQEIARAAPQPGRSPLPAQFSSPLPEAVAGLARTGQAIAGTMMDDAYRAKLEQDRQIEADLKELAHRRQAAEKAQALNELASARQALDELGAQIDDGLQNGTIAKTDAERIYRERLAEIRTERLSRVPEEHRGAIGRDLDTAGARLGGAVRRAVGKQDEADTRAGLLSHLEVIEREAVKNPGALAIGLTAIEELGPWAGFNGEQRQKLAQTLRERVTLNRATAAFSAAKQSVAALGEVEKRLAGDEFADLDPARRTALLDRIETQKLHLQQRAEIAAQRAAREAEHRLRVAGAAAEGMSQLLDRGLVPDEGYIGQVEAAVRGTPFEAVVPALMKQAATTGGFASQPLAVMDAHLNELRNRAGAGTNPEQQKQIERLQKLRDAAERDYRDDPLVAARNRGVLPSLQQLDMSNLAALAPALAARREAAGLVATITGQPVSLLTATEAENLGSYLRTMPVQQQATAIEGIVTALGPGDDVRAMAGQIAGKDRTMATAIMLAATGNRTSAGRSVAEVYLRGAEVLATKANKGQNDKELRAQATIHGNMAQEIGDAYFAPSARDMYVDAAVKIQAALKAEGATDADERAVRLATGGITVNRGGFRTVKPYGWTDSEFSGWLTATAEQLRAAGGSYLAGGTALTAEQLAAALPRSRLAAVGEGQYVIVGAGGQILRRPDGGPLVLDANR